LLLLVLPFQGFCHKKVILMGSGIFILLANSIGSSMEFSMVLSYINIMHVTENCLLLLVVLGSVWLRVLCSCAY
jgi:hypothetical protein